MRRVEEIGISGFATYFPPHRVDLEKWCAWTGNNWEKISAVVGTGFRLPGCNENAYTMAATAVLRLFENYEIDPTEIGFFALATESSTDNSIGTIIVKGMVDARLKACGKAQVRRSCEVPEFKHACLSGIYALKSALRYVALDGQYSKGIVVCSDIAEYERGSSGEQTQGAGAVAFLIEQNPKLLSIDLNRSGSGCSYRGPDFRKPFYRFTGQDRSLSRVRDFPIFNGSYSTTCYLDEVLYAFQDYRRKCRLPTDELVRTCAGIYLHRPYKHMANVGRLAVYIQSMVHDTKGRGKLRSISDALNFQFEELERELQGSQPVYELVLNENLAEDVFCRTRQVIRYLLKKEETIPPCHHAGG